MAVRKFSVAVSPAIVATVSTNEHSFAVGPGDLNLSAGAICSKPTAQAGLGVGTARVVSATNVAVTFINTSGVGITPTAGEVYQVTVID